MKWIATTLAAVGVMLFSATPASADCGNEDGIKNSGNLIVAGLTTDQRLVAFRECQPGQLRDIGLITGLQGSDTRLVGIDYRVQDGRLYGVGNGGGVYVIDTATAAATLVSHLTIALAGTTFGVDFNPAADRLRIVSDTGQNLRHNVNPGGTTIADATLSHSPPAAALGITGAAYVNNDLDPNTGTTLFDIDSALNQVVIQSPPNAGTLTAAGRLTVDAGAQVGFDIYTTLRDGRAIDNRGYASLVVDGVPGFYTINILTGEATLVGELPVTLIDVAVPL